MDANTFAALAAINSHWQSGKAPKSVLKFDTPRRSFYHLIGCLGATDFHLLVGPRQVGKTTLMGHLIQHLLGEGINSRSIVYLPMDHPRVSSAGDLTSLVEGLLQRLPGPLYLFVDELQTVPEWASDLKALHDAHHGAIHLFASGSNALSLASPRGHGVGRWQHHWVLPLKFVETFQRENGPPHAETRRALRACLSEGANLNEIAPNLKAAYYDLLASSPDVEARFFRFVAHGGFPASWAAEDGAQTAFLDTVVHYGLQQDLLGLPQIRRPDAVLHLLGRMAMANGGKLSVNSQAQELDASREAISGWIKALEFAFMIRRVPAVDKNGNVQARRWDKVYLQDSGVRGYLAVEPRWDDIERGRIGETIEGVILDHLHRLQSSVLGHARGTIGYHSKPEVDFIADLGRRLLALEVKFGQDDPGHLAGLFADANRIVVTKNRFEVGGDISYLPAWFFCYIC